MRLFRPALLTPGGYDAVRRYARSWSKSRGAMTGEAYRHDRSHEIALIARVFFKGARTRGIDDAASPLAERRHPKQGPR